MPAFILVDRPSSARQPVRGGPPAVSSHPHVTDRSPGVVSVSAGAAATGRRGHVITPVSITGGYQQAGTGPQVWVIAAAGLAIGLGSYSGGWRIMRTMGKGIIDIQSPQSFAAETTSAAAILASSHLGLGLSTTQVCSGSIVGSGIGKRLADVRCGPQDGLRLAVDAAGRGRVRRDRRRHRVDRHPWPDPGVRRAAGRWRCDLGDLLRAPVSADNVNDSPDVVITREKASGPA